MTIPPSLRTAMCTTRNRSRNESATLRERDIYFAFFYIDIRAHTRTCIHTYPSVCYVLILFLFSRALFLLSLLLYGRYLSFTFKCLFFFFFFISTLPAPLSYMPAALGCVHAAPCVCFTFLKLIIKKRLCELPKKKEPAKALRIS